jgi:hypothetical protein
MVTGELRKGGAFQAQLSRDGLFLRGDQSRLVKVDQLMEASSESVKDEVLLCISDPPESRAEKAVLRKVLGANFGATLPRIRRFYDAQAGLVLLQPSWEAQRCALPTSSSCSAVSGTNCRGRHLKTVGRRPKLSGS